MKVLAILLALFTLVSCSRQDELLPANTGTGKMGEPIHCEFGQTSFNLSKRAPVDEELTGKGKPPRFNWSGLSTGTTNPAVILLDFDGHTVSNTSWNAFGDIVCAPANLSYEATGMIFNRIANDYSPFNVIVTTDESVFNSTASTKRMRVIFTESWEWFGQAGGTAFLNSFGLASENPCFVFTSLLNYNHKAIAEAGAHEMGHTLGLNHQSSYNGTALVNPYNYGTGSGETGWAPIMGCGYNRNVTTWHNGPTHEGHNVFQDEINMLSTRLGNIPDDVSGTTTGAQPLSSGRNGIINHSADVDCFYVDRSSPFTVSATPFSVAAGNTGSNIDIVLKVYNAQGQLINSINDPAVLHAGTSLPAGEYFVSVSVAANAYSAAYGMLGKYSISLE